MRNLFSILFAKLSSPCVNSSFSIGGDLFRKFWIFSKDWLLLLLLACCFCSCCACSSSSSLATSCYIDMLSLFSFSSMCLRLLERAFRS